MMRFMSAGRCGYGLVLVLACLLAGPSLGLAQDTKDTSKTKAKAAAAESGKLTGRLPPYFSAIVTPEQKQDIYKIQGEYSPKLHDLQAQIDQLTKQRDDKILALLNADQKAKLEKAKADAAAKRKSAKADAAGK